MYKQGWVIAGKNAFFPGQWKKNRQKLEKTEKSGKKDEDGKIKLDDTICLNFHPLP